MFALLLLPSLLHQSTTYHVVLRNGDWTRELVAPGSSAPQPPFPAYQYWGTSDTFLDGSAPLQNNGDSHVLEGGPLRTILLKFGDLERLGRWKVEKATLYLTPSIGGKPHLSSIRAVQLPWGEGPLRRPFFTDKPLIAADWSATWKSRHSGYDGMDWQQNGAMGPGDSVPIEGATMTDDGKEIAISGLEKTVQNMMDRWYENNGFALSFAAPTEFFSSKNVTDKPRLELDLSEEPATHGPDLSVTMIDAKYADANANPPAVWPKDGSNVTYVAHIKNVGDVSGDGFIGAWSVREKVGSGVEVAKKLAPGEETTVSIDRSYKANSSDHRIQPLGFLIKPRGSDAIAANNYLEIQEDAIPVSLKLVGLKELAKPNLWGSSSEDDAIQMYLRAVNNVVLGQSRFSFAPEGCLERVRLAGFAPAGGDVAIGNEDGLGSYHLVEQEALHDMGLSTYAANSPVVTSIEGHNVYLNGRDRWAGLSGGGFTANDISVPGEIQLPYDATYNEVFDQYDLHPTGLLAATDVASLNANLGKPVSSLSRYGRMPGTVLVRAMDRFGDDLPNTELRFYQSKDGQMQTADAAFRLITGANGSVVLPSRMGPNGKGDIFGGLQPDGSNGVFLIAATVNGVTDYEWLKAWQLSDSFARTGKPAAFVELRFNVPFAAVDPSSNRAKGAAFKDSDNTDPNKLIALSDDALTPVQLPNKVGSWIEIDLGKEQAVTEIDLTGDKDHSFWKRFDIVTYYSGVSVQQASPFAHEIDWNWNLEVRPELDANGNKYLAYRGAGRSVRYIRIICREPAAGDAYLDEVSVLGASGL